MILKDKEITQTNDPKIYSGQKQESEVAFHLRRAYKDNKNVIVLNDVMLIVDGETAQIDHLICHTFGFIIVESKSIKGRVSINSDGEWSRSFNEAWFGMKSPVKQAQMQMDILREFLRINSAKLLGAGLMGINKISHREYDILCSISPDVIIERETAPDDILKYVVKNEFLTDALDKIMRLPKNKIANFLNFSDTRPATSDDKLLHIANFILEADKQNRQGQYTAPANLVDKPDEQPKAPDPITAKPEGSEPSVAKLICCKYCGKQLAGNKKTGKFGDYYACVCGKNTPATYFGDVSDINKPSQQAEEVKPEQIVTEQSDEAKSANGKQKYKCKHCGCEEGLKFMRGKHGPFMNCSACNKNTPYKDAIVKTAN